MYQQTHHNNIATRRAAIDFIDSIRMMAVYVGGVKHTRIQVKRLIKDGILDGCRYGITPIPNERWHGNCIIFSTHENFLMQELGEIGR